jgi:catechol 2,3-dioxygenase
VSIGMTTSAPLESEARIDPGTTVGTVRLTVSDLARSQAFYEQALGLRPVELDGGAVAMQAGESGERLVELHGDPSAPRLNRRATGLFHLAILFPSRRDLAFALARVAEARWGLDGASDHLVSEALYLSDPDGNGIELYRDRPREDWAYADGALQMATLPLDLDDLVGELRSESALQRQAPAGTTMGHVHLQVAELRDIEAFYNGVLGFDVVVRGYPGALFVSAGGYHHHLGLNTWSSAGGSAPAPGSIGLRSYDVVMPDDAAVQATLARLQAAGIPIETVAEGALVRDPSGNGIILRAA